MQAKRNLIIGVTVLALLLVPAGWSGGGGWRFFENRLGLVEQEVAADDAEQVDLEARLTAAEFQILRLQSRVSCLEKHVLGKGKCPVLLRR